MGPVGALQAGFGCVRPRHTCRGLVRLTAAVEPSEAGLSGARKAERSFGAMYFRGLVGPIGALQAIFGCVRPRHTCRGLARLTAAVEPSETGLSGAAQGGTQFWSDVFSWPSGPYWRASGRYWAHIKPRGYEHYASYAQSPICSWRLALPVRRTGESTRRISPPAAQHQGLHALGLVCTIRAAKVLPHGGARPREGDFAVRLCRGQVIPPVDSLQLHASLGAVVRLALARRWMQRRSAALSMARG